MAVTAPKCTFSRAVQSIDDMTPDELRAMLAKRREAKRISQAKWRAKAK